MSYLLHDKRLCEQYATLIARFSFNPSNPDDFRALAVTQSLEAHVVWSTMALCRHVAPNPNTTNGQVDVEETSDDPHDAAKRLEIFEYLVSSQYLDSEPLPQTENTRNGSMLRDQLKYREREFWRLIGKFLTLRDDEASSAKEIDDTLLSCRSVLDAHENRDVIYSVAIARHIGQRMAEFPDHLEQPANNDEQDAKAKLFVAKKFIEDEAMGKGTSQVIQRLCGMAIRSWGAGR